MNRIARVCTSTLLLAAAVALYGCNSSTTNSITAPVARHADHDHAKPGQGEHSHESLTLAEAVTELDELRTAIKEAFAADDLVKADGPVHEAGHVLEKVPALAAKTSLGLGEQDAVKKAAEELFECFGKLDDKIHSGKGATYEELSEKIEAAMATLRKHVQKPSEGDVR